jgi:hypothetical protein
LIDRQPLIAPEGTLFLVGPDDVLLTTMDGGEATIPLSDLAALFQLLFSVPTAESEHPAEGIPPLGSKLSQGS